MLGEATPLAVMLYAYISVYAKCAITDEPEIFMPREKLQYDLYGSKGRGGYQVKKVLEGIEELDAVRYDESLKGVFIRKDALWPERFVSIHGGELDKIRNGTEPGYSQWLLFYYFCYLIDSLNSKFSINGRKKIVGFMSQQYFAEKLDLGVTTIREYNAKLEELEILYIARRGKHSNNMYCRYSDRNLLRKYLTDIEK